MFHSRFCGFWPSFTVFGRSTPLKKKKCSGLSWYLSIKLCFKRSQSGYVSLTFLLFWAVQCRFLWSHSHTVKEAKSVRFLKKSNCNYVIMKWPNNYSLGNLKWNAHVLAFLSLVNYIIHDIVTASLLMNVFRSCFFIHFSFVLLDLGMTWILYLSIAADYYF